MQMNLNTLLTAGRSNAVSPRQATPIRYRRYGKVQHAGADRSAVNLMHGTRVGGQLRTVLLGSLDRTALLDAVGLEVKDNKAVPGFESGSR